MNLKLSNIIGSTVDPRPQDDVLQKNVTVIFRYEEVCPALDCKLIYVIKNTAWYENEHATSSNLGRIDFDCLCCFRIFLIFFLHCPAAL